MLVANAIIKLCKTNSFLAVHDWSKRWKKSRLQAFKIFAAIAGTVAPRDVWIHERSQSKVAKL